MYVVRPEASWPPKPARDVRRPRVLDCAVAASNHNGNLEYVSGRKPCGFGVENGKPQGRHGGDDTAGVCVVGGVSHPTTHFAERAFVNASLSK